MKTPFGRSLAALGALMLAAAAPPAGAADMGISGHVGTLGAGFDLAYGVSDNLVTRIGVNKLTVSDDFTEDDIEYSADLELESVHALADWHAFGGGFRVTGGVVFNNNGFSGKGEVEAGDEIGGFTAPSDGELNLDVSYDDAAPYLGIGWGNRVRGWSKLAFSVDVGVMAQRGVEVTLDDNGTTGADQDDLDAEAQKVEDELDKYDIYPVISASLVYRF